MPLGGGSCPSAALEAALTFAEHSSTRKNAIAYLGDGGGTCRGREVWDYLDGTFRQVTRRNNGRATLHVLGIGMSGPGEAHWRGFTEANNGTFIRLHR